MEKKNLTCSDLCIDDSPAVVLANLKNYVDNAQVPNDESVFDNFKAQLHLLCIKEKLSEYFSVKEHGKETVCVCSYACGLNCLNDKKLLEKIRKSLEKTGDD